MRAWLVLVALLVAATSPVRADDGALYEWRQHPGASLPLQVAVSDEAGRPLALRRLFVGTPVVLDLGYFACPSLCGVVREDLFGALAHSGLRAGRDVELVSLSIDAHETAAAAAAAKARDLAASPGIDGAGVHYLTAGQGAIDAVTSAVGFRADYDARYRQFLHPTGVVVLTGSGIVSGYLLGVGYAAGDLRAAVVRARSGGIARAALPILLLCFHYDASTGRYTLAVVKLLRLLAALTILGIGGLLAVLQRRRRRDSAGCGDQG